MREGKGKVALFAILLMILSFMPTAVLANTTVSTAPTTITTSTTEQNMTQGPAQNSTPKTMPQTQANYTGPDQTVSKGLLELPKEPPRIEVKPNVPDFSAYKEAPHEEVQPARVAQPATEVQPVNNLLGITVTEGELPNVTGTVYLPDSEVSAGEGIKIIFSSLDATESYYTSSDANGSFQYSLPLGTWEVKVYAPMELPYCDSTPQTFELMEGETLPLSLYLTNPQITGMVKDELGNPLPQMKVKVGRSSDGPWIAGASISDNGFYKIGGLSDGEYDVRVWNNQGMAVDRNITITNGQASVIPLDMSVPFPNVNGIIRVPDQTIPGSTGLQIKHLSPDKSRWFSNWRFIGGEQISLFLPDGEYYVTALPNELGNWAGSYPQRLVIQDGVVVEPSGLLTLTLTEPQMTGTVLDASGYPLGNAQVEMRYVNTSGQPWQETYFNTQWMRTNAQGIFQFGGLNDGEYELVAYSDFGESYAETVYISSGQYSGPHDIHVRPYNLKGRVTDPNGLPYTDVWVMLRTQDGYYNWNVNPDSEGNYGAVVPPGNYDVFAFVWQNSPYTNSQMYSLSIGEGSFVSQDLELTLPFITGTVKKSDGNLCSNAYIYVDDPTGHMIYETQTESDGSFKIGGIPTGSFTINAYDSETNQEVTQDLVVENTDPQKITLQFPTQNVKGKVLDPNNQSVAYATLDIWQDFGDGGYNGWYVTRSNENGEFEFTLNDGEYYVTARPSGDSLYARSFSEKISIQSGICSVGSVTLTLTDSLFTGTLLDSQGHPINDTHVQIRPLSVKNSLEFFDKDTVRTKIDGSFKIGGIPDGEYEVYSQGPSGESQHEEVSILGGVANPTTVQLVIQEANFKGKVLTPEGFPAAYCNINFEHVETGQWVNIQTDRDGNFVASLNEGDYWVEANPSYNSPYAHSMKISITITQGQIVEKDIYLTLPSLIGTVYDSQRNIISDAWISIHSEDSSIWDNVTANTAGQYKIGGLPAGNYIINAQNQSTYSDEVQVTLTEGQQITQDLTMKDQNVSGKVFGVDNQLTGDAVVKFFGSSYGNSNVPVLPDGSYSVFLPSGDYTAWASSQANPGVDSLPLKFSVVAGSKVDNLNFTLQNPMIKGKIFDADGNPLRNIQVDFRAADQATRDQFIYGKGAQSNDFGHFALGVVHDGNYQVTIHSDFAKPQVIPVTVAQGVATPAQIDIVMPRINIEGKVVAPDGVTVINYFGIDIEDSQGGYWSISRWKVDGTYQLALEDGEYWLTAYPYNNSAYQPSKSVRITVENGQLTSGTTTIQVEKRPLVSVYQPYGQNKLTSVRYTGSDAILTNLAAIKAGWTQSTEAVFVSPGVPAENVAGLFIGGAKHAPVFLVNPNGPSPEQFEELSALGVTSVTLIGGISSFLTGTESSLASHGITSVTRISGADRYETTAKAVDYFTDFSGTSSYPTVIVASGQNSKLAGALLAAGFAGKNNIPVLLADADLLQVTTSKLAELNPNKIILLSLPDTVNSQIAAAVPNAYVQSIYGEDLSEKIFNLLIELNVYSNANIPFNIAHTVVAPIQSFNDLTTASTLGAQWDVLPQVSEINNPQYRLLDYLMTGSYNRLSPRDAFTQLDIIGDQELISDEAVQILSLGSEWTSSENYQVYGEVPEGVKLMLNDKLITIEPNNYGSFSQEIQLTPGFNKLTFVATKDQETQTIERYVFLYAPETEPLSIDTPYLPVAVVGEPFNFGMSASGGQYPYTWSAVNLPNGLQINPDTGEIYGVPTGATTQTVSFEVKDGQGQTQTLDLALQVLPNQASDLMITPTMQMSGQDPNVEEPAGILVGIKEIKDSTGNVLPDQKIAGYQLEIEYDENSVNINENEITNLGNMGPAFTVVKDPDRPGLIRVGDVSVDGAADMSRLLFIPIVPKGSAYSISPLQIRFTDLSDKDLNTYQMPAPMNLSLQRGKAVNQNTTTAQGPRIADAIGGLQYLAGLRYPGFGTNEVNVMNLASIVHDGDAEDFTRINDIIALMQYFAKIRDEYFQSR